MKKIYLMLLLQAASIVCFSQVSVTATSGISGPSSYPTLKAAFDAVNNGVHQGAVTISISSNTTEAVTAALSASGSGGATYASVRIIPSGSGEKTISGTIAAPLVDLDGADMVTIEGTNTGGGSLTFINTSTSNSGSTSTIRFGNDASNNKIINATILGASTSNTLGTVLFTTGPVTGNDNNVIRGCRIGDANGSFPANAIFSAGNTTPGQENSQDSILNNEIYNFFHADIATSGVNLGAGNTGWGISGNRFYQTQTRMFTTASTHKILFVGSGNNYQITNNTIGFSSASGTGSYTLAGAVATRLTGIELALAAGNPSEVNSNTIAGISLTTSSNASTVYGIFTGIYVTAGDATIGGDGGNLIGSETGTGSITLTPTAGGTMSTGISISGSGTITVTGNKIGGIDLLPNTNLSGTINAIQVVSGSAGTFNISSNVIGNATANNIRVGVAGTTSNNGNIRGVLNSGSGAVNITGNTIRNLTHFSNNSLALFRAIEYQNGTGMISGNNISNMTTYGGSTSTSTVGGSAIQVGSTATGITVSDNMITNLVSANTSGSGINIFGIYLVNGVNGVTVRSNKIYGISNAATGVSTTAPPVMAGIYIREAVAANPITIYNNMISLGSNQSTNTAIIGIWNQVNSTNNYLVQIVYNTVNIEGTAASGSHPSFCYFRGDFSANPFAGPQVDLKNNIFVNNRGGGTGKHYALANSYPVANSSPNGWISDYNVLNAGLTTVGYWSADQTFANWKTTSSQDANSLSDVAVVFVNSANDLHLVTSTGTNAAVDGKGTPIPIFNTDIDNETRNATAPDPGADEFTQGALAITMEYFTGKKVGLQNELRWKVACTSNTVTFDIERSNNARSFTSMGRIVATQAQCNSPFQLVDPSPTAGTNYYRLKMTEADGKVTYSFIIAIINKNTGFEVVNMLPTLVNSGQALINVASAKKTNVQLVITDVAGRTVYQQREGVDAGNSTLRINMGNLQKGFYQLNCSTTEGDNHLIRFAIQ